MLYAVTVLSFHSLNSNLTPTTSRTMPCCYPSCLPRQLQPTPRPLTTRSSRCGCTAFHRERAKLMPSRFANSAPPSPRRWPRRPSPTCNTLRTASPAHPPRSPKPWRRSNPLTGSVARQVFSRLDKPEAYDDAFRRHNLSVIQSLANTMTHDW